MQCAGILLTGGASSRMGADKASLPTPGPGPGPGPGLGRVTLARRAAAVLTAVAAPVIEVGPGRAGIASVADDLPGGGPLAAVARGLHTLDLPDRAVIVLACDMPLVTVELLTWLAVHPSAGSVVPLAGSPLRAQTLCARWSPEAQRRVHLLVGAGERSMRALLDDLPAADLTRPRPEEWGPAAGWPREHALDDADTPEDIERIRALMRSRPGP